MGDLFVPRPVLKPDPESALEEALWRCDCDDVGRKADDSLSSLYKKLQLPFVCYGKHVCRIFTSAGNRNKKKYISEWKERHVFPGRQLLLCGHADLLIARALSLSPRVLTFANVMCTEQIAADEMEETEADSSIGSTQFARLFLCALCCFRGVRMLRFHHTLAPKECAGGPASFRRGDGKGVCAMLSPAFVPDALVSAATRIINGGWDGTAKTFGETALLCEAVCSRTLHDLKRCDIPEDKRTLVVGEDAVVVQWAFGSPTETVNAVSRVASDFLSSLSLIKAVCNGVTDLRHTEGQHSVSSGVVDTSFVCTRTMPRLAELHTSPLPSVTLSTKASRVPFVSIPRGFSADILRVTLPMDNPAPTRIGCAESLKQAHMRALVLEFQKRLNPAFPFNLVESVHKNRNRPPSDGEAVLVLPGTLSELVLRFGSSHPPLSLLKNGLETLRLRKGAQLTLTICPLGGEDEEIRAFREWAREKGIRVETAVAP